MDSIRATLLCIAAVAFVGCGETSTTVRASGKVEVFETFPKNEPGNKIIATLSSGDAAPVVSTRYSKEFLFYRIRLPDGRQGYVMLGDDFKVEQNAKK